MSNIINKVVNMIKDGLTMSVFLIPAIMAPYEADAASLADAAGYAQATGISCSQQKASPAMIAMDRQAKRISKLAMTKDCKYVVYDLDGELDDLNYSSKDGSIIWQPGDLMTRIGYLEASDVGRGYTCEFVCKDTSGNIVGIHPAYKKSAKTRK